MGQIAGPNVQNNINMIVPPINIPQPQPQTQVLTEIVGDNVRSPIPLPASRTLDTTMNVSEWGRLNVPQSLPGNLSHIGDSRISDWNPAPTQSGVDQPLVDSLSSRGSVVPNSLRPDSLRPGSLRPGSFGGSDPVPGSFRGSEPVPGSFRGTEIGTEMTEMRSAVGVGEPGSVISQASSGSSIFTRNNPGLSAEIPPSTSEGALFRPLQGPKALIGPRRMLPQDAIKRSGDLDRLGVGEMQPLRPALPIRGARYGLGNYEVAPMERNALRQAGAFANRANPSQGLANQSFAPNRANQFSEAVQGESEMSQMGNATGEVGQAEAGMAEAGEVGQAAVGVEEGAQAFEALDAVEALALL